MRQCTSARAAAPGAAASELEPDGVSFVVDESGTASLVASASPAVGYSHLHQEQQKALVDGAFAKLKGFVLTK